MKNTDEKYLKIRIALSLNTLMERSKTNSLSKGKNDDVGDSYNKIALNSGIRKATVSDTFNAKSAPKSTTLIRIIEAMGFKVSDFSKIYDSLRDEEVLNFKAKLKG
ncbi:hypothetical protein ED312_07350 [Sinomicrobium pectinilyticum]|uniref:HTH cro/C1-type domain-containing protein n=1 Tax=Sinomicrobium pectinilyticum TaxID=1084421 RepID=A0A3N0ENJ8_SINP1|nr:hypothetical protein [Sinomicrobium pectinilyticum]RNL89460.1 hypothetical protein ED312_07350 [Sinomicrobium pectinilyticum]